VRRSILVLAVVLASCEATEEPGDGSTSTGTAQSTSTSSSSSSSSESTAAETAPMGPGLCRRECMLPNDCCGGADPCPSMEYPGNVACEGGLCIPATCTSAQQCEAAIPGSTCESVDGFEQCVVLCEDDAPCAALGADFTCGSPTDGGARYCNRLCTTGAVVCSAGTCDDATGLCLCESSDQCVTGFRCV
jgi:hypothetical protein